ncbi:Segregation and condensation protein A [Dietzia timorensis]|uniref:Segregation and condensation protein A n=1 Tax=Dietzia timorensis TaxID=499555 RepID=A0A173LNZ9_9ACTN|nr:segregation/condensation protein A [Dietzia timorensis]ANI92280.1 Segregation and condensation protein A [Dietzia timorensis]
MKSSPGDAEAAELAAEAAETLAEHAGIGVEAGSAPQEGSEDGHVGNAESVAADDGAFSVHLRNFTGPFDLLLQLIDSKRLDVTEVALHEVTDEFVAYTRDLGAEAGLEQVTEFLVVAATLLDLKAARLIPHGEVEDPEDLALLQARDLLFARLLQFRAFARVADMFTELERAAMLGYPRAVGPEERFIGLLPEVEIGLTPEGFAELAAVAMRPRPVDEVGIGHIHAPAVSVPEQAGKMLAMFRLRGKNEPFGFAELVADCGESLEIVARFLGLLELYRARAVALFQDDPDDDLIVTWTGEDAEDVIKGSDEWN